MPALDEKSYAQFHSSVQFIRDHEDRRTADLLLLWLVESPIGIMQKGSIVKYSRPCSPLKKSQRFVLLTDPSEKRVDIQDASGKFYFPPIETVDISEVELAER